LAWTTTGAQRCVGSGPGWSRTYEGKAAAQGSFTTVELNARNNEFSFTCTGAGGTSVRSLTVTALSQPKVTLEASSDRALPGGSVQLTWRSQDATSCTASGAPFTGTKSTSGTERLSDLTKGTKTFKLSCKGLGGSGSDDLKVTVIAKPTLTFSASRAQIAENSGTQLRWRSTDASGCLASGDWSGPQNTSGNVATGNLSSDRRYTLTCTGLNGDVKETVTVEVVAAPVVSLSISDEVVAPGESVTLDWAVERAQSCTASGGPFTGSKSASVGRETLSNLTRGARTLKLTCKGIGGTTSAEVKLNVIAKPTLTLSASRSPIGENTGTQLRWRATDATSCLASGDWSGPQNTSGSFDTGALASDKTYRLTCTGLNGEVEETLTVEVIPAPTVSLSLSDTLVEPGTAVTVSWESEYAQSCSASGSGWSGSRELTGTESVTFATPNKRVFTLTCRGVGGSKTATADLGVFPRPQILSFTADPSPVQAGQTTTLKWQTQDTRSCTASGAWSGTQARNSTGKASPVLTQRTNVLTLTCQGDGGETSESVTVEAQGAPEITLSADRTLVTSGENATLTWTSTDATSCTASGAWSGNKALSGSETSAALETGSYTFTLNCTNKVGSDTKSVSVESAKPEAAIDVATLAFGDTGAGLTPRRSLKVTNTGKVPLTALSATLVGANADQFALTSNCAATLAANAACSVEVTFRPTGFGAKSATLEISGAGASPLAVALSGTAAFQAFTVSKSGAGSGTVASSPAGIDCGSGCTANFNIGTSVTLTATAANDSTFTGWSGACTGTAACTVTVDQAKSVTATFTLKKFALTVAKAGTGSGSVTSDPTGISCGEACSGDYTIGTSVTLTATAANDSTFTGWTGCATTNGNACTVTVDQAKSVTATFTLKKFALTVTKAGAGSGSVTSDPTGISCGEVCEGDYTINTAVTLTAAAANDSTFTGWSGACTGTAACTVTIDQAKSVTATFVLKTFELAVVRTGSGSGTVTSVPAGIECGTDCAETYTIGTSVTLTATAANDSTFTGWGGACTGTAACTVTMDQAKSVTATFASKTPVLTVTKAGSGRGKVTSSLTGIDCGETCSSDFTIDTSVTLIATAENDSTFEGWSGACTGTATCTVTMDQARSVTATFALKTFALSVSRSGNGSGTVTSSPAGINCGSTCSASFNVGSSVTLTASAANNSTFTGWSGACSGTGSCSVTMSEARSVSAAFEAGLSAADLSLSLDVLGYAESSVSGVISVSGAGNSSVEFSIETPGEYGTATINSTTGTVTYTVIGSPAVVATSDQVVVKVTAGAASTTARVNVSLRHDPLFAYQWHLRNVGQSTFADVSPTPGADINVESAWAAGYSGNGVKVAVVDSGLEIGHEDLLGNIDVGKSIDFATDGTDPTYLKPAASDYGDPGTKVAGIIAAQAFNGKGGRGIAHRSRLRGYNLARYDALSLFGRAFGLDPRSEDADIFVGSYGSGNQLMPSSNSSKIAVLNTTTSLRSGKGAVVVFGAGNNFENNGTAFSQNSCDNSPTSIPVSCSIPAADDFKQSIVPIIVGALAADGKKASYSNASSSIWVSAPGGEFGYQASVAGSALTANAYKPAIVTSNTRGCANYSGSRNTLDRAGLNPLAASCQYTASMNGTGAAAAMVGGISALMLEANPNLGYRDVAHILAMTAKKVDPTFSGVSATLANASRNLEPGWITNAAGYNFSNRYGFGAVDAGAAVAMAKTYSDFLPKQALVSRSVRLTSNLSVGASGRVVNFAISSSLSKTERVSVKVSLFMRDFGSTGTSCNQIELTSPAGTRSVLLNARNGFKNSWLTDVLLSSNAFYGENPNGTWQMTVYDWCPNSFSSTPTQFSSTAFQEFSLVGH
jgi:hypothetical protein